MQATNTITTTVQDKIKETSSTEINSNNPTSTSEITTPDQQQESRPISTSTNQDVNDPTETTNIVPDSVGSEENTDPVTTSIATAMPQTAQWDHLAGHPCSTYEIGSENIFGPAQTYTILANALEPTRYGWDQVSSNLPASVVSYWGFDQDGTNSIPNGDSFTGPLVQYIDGYAALLNDIHTGFSTSAASTLAADGARRLDRTRPFTVSLRARLAPLRTSEYNIPEVVRTVIAGEDDWGLVISGTNCKPLIMLNGPFSIFEEPSDYAHPEKHPYSMLLQSTHTIDFSLVHTFDIAFDHEQGTIILSIDNLEREVWVIDGGWEWRSQTEIMPIAIQDRVEHLNNLTTRASEYSSFVGAYDWILVSQGQPNNSTIAELRQSVSTAPDSELGDLDWNSMMSLSQTLAQALDTSLCGADLDWGVEIVSSEALQPSSTATILSNKTTAVSPIGYWTFANSGFNSVPNGESIVPHEAVKFKDGKLIAELTQSTLLTDFPDASSWLTPVTEMTGPSLDRSLPFTIATRTKLSNMLSIMEPDNAYIENVRSIIALGNEGTQDITLGVVRDGCRPIIVINGPSPLYEYNRGNRVSGRGDEHQEFVLISDRSIDFSTWHTYILGADSTQGVVTLTIDGSTPETWTIPGGWSFASQSWTADDLAIPDIDRTQTLNSIILSNYTTQNFAGMHDWIFVGQGSANHTEVLAQQSALELQPTGSYGTTYDAIIDQTDSFVQIPIPSNEWKAKWSEALIENTGTQIKIVDAIQRLFPDKFDFLIIAHNFEDIPADWPAFAGKFMRYQNNVQGLGVPILDDRYISQNLKGIIIDPTYRLEHGLLIHEIVHNWGQRVIPDGGKHWDAVEIRGALGGLGQNVQTNGDGTYTIDEEADRATPGLVDTLPNIELYLMGLVPAESVQPLTWYDGLERIKADEISTIFRANQRITTIEDIVSKHGARQPNWQNSQKEFRGIVVLVTPQAISQSLSNQLDSQIKGFEEYFSTVTSGLARLSLTGLTQFSLAR